MMRSIFPRARWFSTSPAACLAALLALAGALASSSAVANINDNFNRADSAAIGNGWIEKDSSAFSISGNSVRKLANSSGYRDNLVHRPAGEDVADVEASVRLRLTNASPGYPQILVRVQSGTVGFTDSIDGYIVYVNDSNSQAVLGRQSGSNFVTTLATINISPALNTTDSYRLRLRATGSNPVLLEGFVERDNAGTWQTLGQASFSDSSAQRFSGAGSVGFSGYIEGNYFYDDFVRTNLASAPNPTPATSSLAPSSALQGESGLTLTVNGSNFVPASEVRWAGAPRTTVFVSSTQLEATIPAPDLSGTGTRQVTVFNPTPGGGTSNAQTFTINANPTPNPVPSISSLNPNSVVAGSATFTLTVNGSSFASTATVRVNGSDRATTFVSASQLTASIPASDVSSAGSRSITVFNPTPGGGVSNTATLTVTTPPPSNPVPVANSLNPSSTVAGSAAFTLQVQGSSFINGSTVRWNGANRATTFVSATQLNASIPASDVSSAGTASVTVFTGTPGGGTSATRTFTITAPPSGSAPGMTSLSPLSATVGSGNTLMTVTGSGFTVSSVIRWNGTALATTFLSGTQVRATLGSSQLGSAGIGTITVQNGSAVSLPLSFFVVSSGSQVFFDGFNRANGTSLGNSWAEKMASAFNIQDGTVVGNDTYPYGFHDTIATRPSGEDQLNVEVGKEFIRQPGNFQFPQVHARIQRNSLPNPDTLESYIFYVEENFTPPGGAVIAVQPPVFGTYECLMLQIPFPSALQVGTRYRLRFRVEGSYPVQLTGIVERFDGAQWQVFASGSMTHDNNTQRNPNLYCPYSQVPPPITSAGAVGFAKWTSPGDVVDNFHWISLGGGGPPPPAAPSISGLSPLSTTAGSGAFTLTVNGSNFAANSAVRWNGGDRTTTFISATQLQATITATDVSTAGSFPVTVSNGGGTPSAATNFSVTPPPSGASFVDDFTRANSDVLGNGWLEKTSSAFFLNANQAAKQVGSGGYRDNVVYRPAGENVLNVEASMLMRLQNAAPGYPQLLTRVQTGTVTTFDALDAYMLYVNNNSSEAILARQNGSNFVVALATLNISPALNTTDTYRLRLSTTGTAAVQLQAFVERLDGGGWQIIGQASATDTSAQRISTAGSVGFSGYIEGTYAFDSFTRTNLP